MPFPPPPREALALLLFPPPRLPETFAGALREEFPFAALADRGAGFCTGPTNVDCDGLQDDLADPDVEEAAGC